MLGPISKGSIGALLPPTLLIPFAQREGETQGLKKGRGGRSEGPFSRSFTRRGRTPNAGSDPPRHPPLSPLTGGEGGAEGVKGSCQPGFFSSSLGVLSVRGPSLPKGGPRRKAAPPPGRWATRNLPVGLRFAALSQGCFTLRAPQWGGLLWGGPPGPEKRGPTPRCEVPLSSREL